MRFIFLTTLLLLSAKLAAAQDLNYTVSLRGVDGDLRERIEEQSRLLSLQDEPPETKFRLERRIATDRERIDAILDSEGYYAGEVEITLREEAAPAEVVIEVDPGEPFILSSFLVRFTQPELAGILTVPLEQLGIELGRRARSEDILAAQQELLDQLAMRGRPYPEIADQKAIADFETRGLQVTTTVDPGPFALFGEPQITGLEEVEPTFIRQRIPWNPGDVFDVRMLEEARTAIARSGLFASVRVRPAEELGPDGRLPIIFDVTERAHRSFGGGIGFNTATGAELEVFWEHRNFLSAGETFQVSVEGSNVLQRFDVEFRNPDFGGRNQDLLAAIEIRREDNDSFKALGASASLGMEWKASDRWSVSALGRIERIREEDVVDIDEETRDFTLLSFPLIGQYDSTDAPLDPTQGNRLRMGLTPFFELSGEGENFYKLEISNTAYLGLDADDDFILAGWGALGFTFGADRRDIPGDERFYAGGGGSIRGYGFQRAGPLDEADDPIGGKSLLAFGGEVRGRFTETIGGVAFLEGGSVFRNEIPDFSDRLFWGAGVGLRYYTAFGPIRADIAVPLDPRSSDDKFQVYLSLGQAF